MKILSIGDYNGNLSLYEAQLKQFIIMYQRGIHVTIQGTFSEEIETILVNANIDIIKDKPLNKKDKEFCSRLLKTVNSQEFKIVHVFGGKNTSNACIALKKSDVKIIGYMGSTSIHWHDPSAYKTYLNPRIDTIICNSIDNARHFKKQLFFNKNKVKAIYKGYDTAWFHAIKKADLNDLGIQDSSIVISCVGHVRRVKAVDLFIEATHYLSDNENLHFLLIGIGTNSLKMQKLKEKSPFKNRIHLLGHRKDIKEILKRTDIYVQTSIKEGLGRAITESMCLKKPIVVTNAGGCTELVADGVSGYIAKNKNPKSIAEKITLLINDSEKRTRFGEESYRRIQTIFNIENTVNQTIELYKKLLKE